MYTVYTTTGTLTVDNEAVARDLARAEPGSSIEYHR